MTRPVYVAFATRELERSYERLASGDDADRTLHAAIARAIVEIKRDPVGSVRVPQRLWPVTYARKHCITNLWKHDLSKGWRLIYTIQSNEVEVLDFVLDIIDHKEYDRKFGYKGK